MKFNSGQFKKGQTSPNKGKVFSVETRLKMKMAKLGKKVIFTDEHKKNLSLACAGKPRFWMRNRKRITPEMRNKMIEGRRNKWADRSLLKKREDRKSQSYIEWQIAVRTRDGYRCKMENDDCQGILETHHILPWREYPELRYDLNNGILLCKYHHPRKYAEEARLSPYFISLISQQ